MRVNKINAFEQTVVNCMSDVLDMPKMDLFRKAAVREGKIMSHGQPNLIQLTTLGANANKTTPQKYYAKVVEEEIKRTSVERAYNFRKILETYRLRDAIRAYDKTRVEALFS